jgi:hypothetical protein
LILQGIFNIHMHLTIIQHLSLRTPTEAVLSGVRPVTGPVDVKSTADHQKEVIHSGLNQTRIIRLQRYPESLGISRGWSRTCARQERWFNNIVASPGNWKRGTPIKTNENKQGPSLTPETTWKWQRKLITHQLVITPSTYIIHGTRVAPLAFAWSQRVAAQWPIFSSKDTQWCQEPGNAGQKPEWLPCNISRIIPDFLVE